MLDSSKSLQKREISKERRSEVANKPTDSTTDAAPLDSNLIEKIHYLESALKSGAREGFPPEYRGLIEQYFKALSKQTQRGL